MNEARIAHLRSALKGRVDLRGDQTHSIQCQATQQNDGRHHHGTGQNGASGAGALRKPRLPIRFPDFAWYPDAGQMSSREITFHDLTAARAPRAESATRTKSKRIIGSQRPWLE